MGFNAKPPSHIAVIVALASLVSHPTLPHCGQVAWSARECTPWGWQWSGQEQSEGSLEARPSRWCPTGALVIEN